jgi:hypothetical protein
LANQIGDEKRGSMTSPNYKSSPLKTVIHELRHGKFFANAQARSSRRKSRWNMLLLLVVPLWLFLFMEGTRLARVVAHAFLRDTQIPADLVWPYAVAPFFAYFPMFIATVVPAMVLVNYFIYLCVPPARRAMDAEDLAYPGTEYATQQPLLVAIALVTLPVAFAISVAGRIFV